MLMRGGFRSKRMSSRGVILPVVLIVLVVLTVITVGVTRTARMNLNLARRSMATLSARYLAWAGIVYALDEIQQDSLNKESVVYDRIGLCGIAPDPDRTIKDRFHHVVLENGFLDIGYDDESGHVDGFSDEESKINLNGLNQENIGVMVQLAQMFGESKDDAQAIGQAVLDWKDQDDDLSDKELGAEDAYYMGLAKPYHVKNYFFESLDELRLVKGVSPELLESLRPYLTIFPMDDFLRINLDTASGVVLKALGRGFTGGQTNTDPEDADALAEKILDYRRGDDGRPGTEDDRLVNFEEMNLNQKENVIAEKMRMTQTTVSDHLRVYVKAVENQRKMALSVEAVIDRNDRSIVQWRRP